MTNMTTAKSLLEDFVSRYDGGCTETIYKDITSKIFADIQISDEQVKTLLLKYIEYREESKSYYAQHFWAELGEGFKRRPLMTIFRVHPLYIDWKRRHDERQQELKTWYLNELEYVLEPSTYDEKEKLKSLGIPEEMIDETAALTKNNHPLYDAPPILERFCEETMKRIRNL